MALTYVKFNLFDFQYEEIERVKKNKSALLAWEMGTGKTYGGIALDIERRGEAFAAGSTGAKKTLVVAPKSVLDVWDVHLHELAGHHDIYMIDPKNRKKFEDALLDKRKGGYFVCHWESLRLMPALGKTQFFHIIADEAHRAKNRKAQQTRALKKIKTTYKTAMSGTPADNNPQDLWSILNWLWPTYYTSYWRFVGAYCIMETSWEGYRKMVGVKNMDHLRNQIKPWYSRKLKKDVLKDLPDKYYSTVWVDLSGKQRKAYDQMQRTMVAWVSEHEEELAQGNPIIAQAVVSQLVRLQQFAVAYMEGYEQYNEKTDEIETKFRMSDPSAKLDTLMEILEDNPDEQIVVFSQFKSVLVLLARRLERAGISHGLFTGDVKDKDRSELVRSFQAGKTRVFAGTIAAGGVGITLTNASIVVFLDRAWSPSLNAQAEDRLHRIGQTNAVQVVDLMAKSTVDIGRKELLQTKSEWLRAVLGDNIGRTAMDNLQLKFTEREKA